MARSPLMIGGDLPSSDAETISLFTNDEVLRILRESTGNRELLRERGLVAWTADTEDTRWVAIFNTDDEPREEPFDTRSLGLGAGPRWSSMCGRVPRWRSSRCTSRATPLEGSHPAASSCAFPSSPTAAPC